MERPSNYVTETICILHIKQLLVGTLLFPYPETLHTPRELAPHFTVMVGDKKTTKETRPQGSRQQIKHMDGQDSLDAVMALHHLEHVSTNVSAAVPVKEMWIMHSPEPAEAL